MPRTYPTMALVTQGHQPGRGMGSRVGERGARRRRNRGERPGGDLLATTEIEGFFPLRDP